MTATANSWEKDGPGGARVGVIDIGSNTVRFVVYDGALRSPTMVFNEKSNAGLGADLAQTGRLSPSGRIKAKAALRRFSALVSLMRLDAVQAVATAAVREAEDGPDFVAEIERDIGLSITIASGADEARLSAQGVLLGDPFADGVVADLGGASMELVDVQSGAIGAGGTMPVGPQRVGALPPAALRAALEAAIDANPVTPRIKGRTLYLVGGAWRALAALDMERTNYPLHVRHGYVWTPEAAEAACAFAPTADPALVKLAGGESRWPTIHVAIAAIRALIARGQPDRLWISAFGLREGVLFDHLSPELRGVDPLLQTCAEWERRSARLPGFGADLDAWLSDAIPAPRRLRLATCMLHAAGARHHPDYRASASFGAATRAHLGGLEHWERVFIGAALIYRYSGAKRAFAQEAATGLLNAEQQRMAKALGRAMRLGAMLCGSSPGVLARCPLHNDGETLRLSVPQDFAALGADLVETRLRGAAEALGLRAELNLQVS